MKKQLLIILMAFVLVFSTACDKNKSEDTASDKEDTKQTEESKDGEDADAKKDNKEEQEDDTKDKEDKEDKEDKNDEEDTKDEDDAEDSSSENSVDKYVETLDEELDVFKNLDYKTDIKLPHLKGKSKLAKQTNKEIKEYFENYVTEDKCYIKIDYSANILNNILSVKIVSQSALAMTCGGSKNQIKSYNFDISDGKIKEISNAEIFDRMTLDKDMIKEFAIEFLDATNRYSLQNEELEQYLENVAELFDDFYENNTLLLYTNTLNDHFILNFANMPDTYGNGHNVELTLDKTKFDMAMLSKPSDDVIGVAYIDDDYDNKVKSVPKHNIFGNKTSLFQINAEDEGASVYFTSFCEDTDYIGIKVFDYLDVDLEYDKTFVKLTEEYEYAIENKAGNIFEYKSILPEGMPNECICIGGDGYYGELIISPDLKDGYQLRYIYNAIKTSTFVETESNEEVITFNTDGTYKANAEYWANKGLILNEGSYSCTNDMSNHICLMPSMEDIDNGASKYYLFNYSAYPPVVALFYEQDAEGNKSELAVEWSPKN